MIDTIKEQIKSERNSNNNVNKFKMNRRLPSGYMKTQECTGHFYNSTSPSSSNAAINFGGIN